MGNVATYPSVGGRGEIKVHLLMKKTGGVATNVYSRKMLEKPKRGLRILKIRVWELFTHGEGISPPCARHKGWQPSIECSKTWLQCYLFFFIFWGQQGCCPCSYVSSGAMRNSDLRSSLSLKVVCYIDFYVFKRFILIANKKSYKALDLEMMF